MLRITIPATEYYDEANNEFIYTKEQTLQLEHSLVSISKWESKWHKPYLVKEVRTDEETIDYIRCMTITQNVDPSVYYAIPKKTWDHINAYLEDPMTATTFSKEEHQRFNRQIITSELIYQWMVALQIPFECEKWHLTRLLTLIRVCNIKNSPPKKVDSKSRAERNRQINAARRQQMNSRG